MVAARTHVATLLLAALVAACAAPGAGNPAAPDPTPSAVPAASVPAPEPTAVPNPGATNGPVPVDPLPGAGGSGGGNGGNPGTGVVDPLPPGIFPIVAGTDPEPQLVTPAAGLVDIHDVAATNLEAAAQDGTLFARVSWWSGVAPCTQFAGVDVARDGDTYTLTAREGAPANLDVMCTEQAVLKAAIVDLGPLPDGGATIRAGGGGDPLEVRVVRVD